MPLLLENLYFAKDEGLFEAGRIRQMATETKHTLYRRSRDQKKGTDDVYFGRGWIIALAVLLAFVLIVTGHAPDLPTFLSSLKFW